MFNYPITKTRTCRYCGAVVTLERQGDGAPTAGGLNFWYTSDHHCPGSDKAIAAERAEHHSLEEILYGGP